MTYHKLEDLWQKFLEKIGWTSQPEERTKEEKEQFSALSRDDKLKLISPQIELYVSAVSQKSEIFPIISTLAATLIVISTLNKDLVPLSVFSSKILLSYFLMLIPVTLHYYIKVKELTARNAMETISSYHTEDPFEELKKVKFLDQLSSDFPILLVYSLYVIIFFVLSRIWFLELITVN